MAFRIDPHPIDGEALRVSQIAVDWQQRAAVGAASRAATVHHHPAFAGKWRADHRRFSTREVAGCRKVPLRRRSLRCRAASARAAESMDDGVRNRTALVESELDEDQL